MVDHGQRVRTAARFGAGTQWRSMQASIDGRVKFTKVNVGLNPQNGKCRAANSPIGSIAAVIASAKMIQCSTQDIDQCHESYCDFVEEVNGKVDDLSRRRVTALETLREAARFLVRANVKDREFDVRSKSHPTDELKEKIETSVIDLGNRQPWWECRQLSRPLEHLESAGVIHRY